MTQFTELREVDCHLSAPDRGELAAFILETLDETHFGVDQAEVTWRRDELNSGLVRGLNLQNFEQTCGR